jgi:hypothetical protein
MTDMSSSMTSSMSMSGGFNMMKRNESMINSKVIGGNNFGKNSGNKAETDKKSILMNNNFGRT